MTKNFEQIDIAKMGGELIKYKYYTEEELKEIVFKEVVTTEFSHTTPLTLPGDTDPVRDIGWITDNIVADLRLVSGYDIIYEKVKDFASLYLFDRIVDLEDKNTIRNLSESTASSTVLNIFKQVINKLTIQDNGSASIIGQIKLRNTKNFLVNYKSCFVPRKSIFNKIVGDSDLELNFAGFLESCRDVTAFAKLYQQIGFKIDYLDDKNRIRDYYPDFVVKLKDGRVLIVETKGLVDIDVKYKIERLKNWCLDVNKQQGNNLFDFVYVPESEFNELLKNYSDGLLKGKNKTFDYLIKSFTEYKA